MRLNHPVRYFAAALALALAAPAAAQEQLGIAFDLQQYTQTGRICFAVGGTNFDGNPSARTNWVHLTAVWVEDDSGAYRTTLYRWGRSYVYNLEQWAASSNMAVDGITESTPTSAVGAPAQVFHNFSTGLRDVSSLPDGVYRIRLETTLCEVSDEYRSGTPQHQTRDASFNFTKGRTSSTVNLGTTFPFQNVTATYVVPTGNTPPGVWAGPDQFLMPSQNPSDDTATLTGVADDPGGAPSVVWTLVDVEPAGALPLILSPTSSTTDVLFDTSGIYTFRLTATDAGSLSNADEVTVHVNTHVLDATHDGHTGAGRATLALGIIENEGPWVAGGGCPVGQVGYFRFDLQPVAAAMDLVRLQLPYGEATFSSAVHHDFYILTDPQDDWNTTNPSTDWEATLTHNNAVFNGSNVGTINPAQLIGTFTHYNCIYRHGYNDPADGPDPASQCPGWVDVELDPTKIGTYDDNDQLSLLMTNRECNTNFFQSGSHENLMNPHLLVVEHWQAGPNAAPIADASSTTGLWVDADGTGDQSVILDGGASSDDLAINRYEWRDSGGALLGTSGQPAGVSLVLPLGVHDLELTVVDGGDLSDTSTVQLIVEDRYHPNRTSAAAAVLSGGPAPGVVYPDLFAYTASPGGDWYELDLAGGGDLTVDVNVLGGDVDARLLDAALNELDASAQAGSADESVSASGLGSGTYYVEVAANGGFVDAGTYDLTVTVVGQSLALQLTQTSVLEAAGTVASVGTVSITAAAAADLDVTLVSGDPAQITFAANPVTITAGSTSTSFGVVVADNAVADGNRLVTLQATAAGYNQGAQQLQIIDDDGAGPIVSWERLSQSVAETDSPLVVLKAVLTERATVSVPFTVAGTATAGQDYQTLVTTTLTINDATEGTLVLNVFDDTAVEADETLVLTMGTPTGALLGTGSTYTLTITDDEGGSGGSGAGNSAGGGGTGGSDSVPRGCSAAVAGWGALTLLLLLARLRRAWR